MERTQKTCFYAIKELLPFLLIQNYPQGGRIDN